MFTACATGTRRPRRSRPAHAKHPSGSMSRPVCCLNPLLARRLCSHSPGRRAQAVAERVVPPGLRAPLSSSSRTAREQSAAPAQRRLSRPGVPRFCPSCAAIERSTTRQMSFDGRQSICTIDYTYSSPHSPIDLVPKAGVASIDRRQSVFARHVFRIRR